jgi:hypothetical protein
MEIRNLALCAALSMLAALLSFALRLAAQQAVPPVAKQMVPNNPAEHPAPEQPIPYSHKQHLALGMECKNCHTNPQPGKLMTFPPTSKCMECHVTIAKGKPSIQKLAAFAKSQKPIPWVRVYTVLPGVVWTHRAHLAANVTCESCHGDVREMATMSEVTSVVTMYSCLTCHEMNHAKTSCDTCHRN